MSETVVDARVSGGGRGPGAGTLTTMVGGFGTAFEQVRPLLDSFGGRIAHARATANAQLT